MLPRHKQAQDNVIQFLGSYLTTWCGWKPTAQAILPQWHMHPQHLHIGLICQAIPLEFHCCYSLIWYISLSTEHSSATQDSPPTLSSYGRKSNSSLPIQCCRSDSDSSPSENRIMIIHPICIMIFVAWPTECILPEQRFHELQRCPPDTFPTTLGTHCGKLRNPKIATETAFQSGISRVLYPKPLVDIEYHKNSLYPLQCEDQYKKHEQQDCCIQQKLASCAHYPIQLMRAVFLWYYS